MTLESVEIFHPNFLPEDLTGFNAWFYADDDYVVLRRLEIGFSNIKPLISQEEFSKRVKELRKSLVDWVDEQSEKLSTEERLFSALDKNPYTNRLLLHLFCLAILSDLLLSGCGRTAIITESLALVETLSLNQTQMGIRVTTHSSWRFCLDYYAKNGIRILGFFRHVLLVCWQILCVRIYFENSWFRRQADVTVLIDTFLHESDIAEDGTFKERYSPGIAISYAEQQQKAAYLPVMYKVPLLKFPSLCRRMLKSKISILPMEFFWKFADVGDVFWEIMVKPTRKQRFSLWSGLDVSPLVSREGFQARCRSFLAMLVYKLPARIKENGIKPSILIDWFENQSIDRALTRGIKESFLNCRVIALRNVVPYDNYLSLFSTSNEVRRGDAPLESWVFGEFSKNKYSEFDRVGIYRVKQASRYRTIFNEICPDYQWGNIVVLLPSDISTSALILSLLKKIISLPILIQPHGDNELNGFKVAVERKFPFLKSVSVSWVREPVKDLLRRASVVITSGSSTAIEACCVGVPVVVVGRRAGLDIHPMENIDSHMWRLVRDETELQEAVIDFNRQDKKLFELRRQIGRRIREQYFASSGAIV